MKCAIMQPTYLPWSGYFNLINSVDTFVFLDDVQFDRRSWQMRNRILLNGSEKIISVCTNKAPRNTLINDITLVNDETWKISHRDQIMQAYSSLYGRNEIKSFVENFMSINENKLADFNISVIKYLAGVLNLQTKFLCASDLGCQGRRSDHLGEITKYLGAEEYLSPQGSRDYLINDGFTDKYQARLLFQEYGVKPYRQSSGSEFVSHLSIIDVIANIGLEATKEYIL